MSDSTNTKALLEHIESKKDLTAEQAQTLADTFFDASITKEHMKAVLVGLNEKGASVDEIVGFAQSMSEHGVHIATNVSAMDTCGTGGDGAHTFNISTATAFVVAACGQAVAKHGNVSVSGKCGSADVLKEVGFDVSMPPEKTKSLIERERFGFLFAPLYHPAMKHVAAVRKEIGTKTIFNMLGPLTNPAGVEYQVIGVFDKNAQQKMAEAAQRLGTKHTLVVSGQDSDEALFDTTHVLNVRPTGIDAFTLEAKDFGLDGTLAQIQVHDVKQGALALRQALQNDEVKGKIVSLNAALALLASGKATSLQSGFTMAEKALESGKAMFKMIECVEACRE